MINKTAKKNEYYNAIIDAVCYWLGYQYKIGRESLIHEASLRYPIADTITAKGTAINQIVLEYLQPFFYGKRIDLVILDKEVQDIEREKDDMNLKELFEFKIAKKTTSVEHSVEHQRVFDDIVRLAYYHLWGNKECYFLMCGTFIYFKTYFVEQKKEPEKEGNKNTVQIKHKPQLTNEDFYPSLEWKPEGLYKDWFAFKIDEEKKIEFTINDNPKWGLKSFQDNYHIKEGCPYKFSDKIKIRTKCLAITPCSYENSRTHAAGIWKIEADNI